MAVEVARFEVEDPEQPTSHFLGAILLHLKADGCAAVHMAEFLLDGMEQVVGLLLVDIEVAVTGDAEEVSAQNLHPMEERPDIVLDETAEKDEVVALLVGLVGEGNDARQDARHLDDGQVGVEPISLEMDDDIEALVEKLGEGMRRIDRQRREDREDLVVEELLEVLALRLRDIGEVMELDVLHGEARLDLLVPAAVLILDLLAGALRDRGELGLGGHAVRRQGDRPHLHLLLETCHAHLKELVEIRADNAEELETLQEGVLLVECLIEHALVELQPAQAPVDEMRWVPRVHEDSIVRCPPPVFKGAFVTLAPRRG